LGARLTVSRGRLRSGVLELFGPGTRLREMASFVVVGGIGFLVDGGVLTILTALFDWGPMAARAVSFPVAVGVTWLLNARFTFRKPGEARTRGARAYTRYLTVQFAGLATNLVVYGALLAAIPRLRAVPIAALAAGSITAMAVTYFGSRHFAFRRTSSLPDDI
jgi:putative flippase GtrA